MTLNNLLVPSTVHMLIFLIFLDQTINWGKFSSRSCFAQKRISFSWSHANV